MVGQSIAERLPPQIPASDKSVPPSSWRTGVEIATAASFLLAACDVAGSPSEVTPSQALAASLDRAAEQWDGVRLADGNTIEGGQIAIRLNNQGEIITLGQQDAANDQVLDERVVVGFGKSTNGTRERSELFLFFVEDNNVVSSGATYILVPDLSQTITDITELDFHLVDPNGNDSGIVFRPIGYDDPTQAIGYVRRDGRNFLLSSKNSEELRGITDLMVEWITGAQPVEAGGNDDIVPPPPPQEKSTATPEAPATAAASATPEVSAEVTSVLTELAYAPEDAANYQIKEDYEWNGGRYKVLTYTYPETGLEIIRATYVEPFGWLPGLFYRVPNHPEVGGFAIDVRSSNYQSYFIDPQQGPNNLFQGPKLLPFVQTGVMYNSNNPQYSIHFAEKDTRISRNRQNASSRAPSYLKPTDAQVIVDYSLPIIIARGVAVPEKYKTGIGSEIHTDDNINYWYWGVTDQGQVVLYFVTPGAIEFLSESRYLNNIPQTFFTLLAATAKIRTESGYSDSRGQDYLGYVIRKYNEYYVTGTPLWGFDPSLIQYRDASGEIINLLDAIDLTKP